MQYKFTLVGVIRKWFFLAALFTRYAIVINSLSPHSTIYQFSIIRLFHIKQIITFSNCRIVHIIRTFCCFSHSFCLFFFIFFFLEKQKISFRFFLIEIQSSGKKEQIKMKRNLFCWLLFTLYFSNIYYYYLYSFILSVIYFIFY